ncbi:MAG: hypothetical protein SVR81_02825 [Chloroflexota bacterium]|nr:hypothetical protein [Chloroflexota bacterium]
MSKKTDRTQPSQPEALETPDRSARTCELHPGKSLHPGKLCPRCGEGKIDYNGLLHLVCPVCGLTEAGACT